MVSMSSRRRSGTPVLVVWSLFVLGFMLTSSVSGPAPINEGAAPCHGSWDTRGENPGEIGGEEVFSGSRDPGADDDSDELPPLTMPPTHPNPDWDIDVFKRLEREKEEGYLQNKTEEIQDSYYHTTKRGFDFIHLEGSSEEIGYRHAVLLHEKIERGMASYAFLTEMRYHLNWDMCRAQGSSYWPYVPTEYRQEIDGLVAGCQEVGAVNPDGDVIDRNDIMAYNAMWDIWWRTAPPGNPLWWWPFGSQSTGGDNIHHCSGFVATGDATEDGGFVMCQSLWMPYHLPPSHGVFADIVPNSGNRMLLELQAGMIWSGTEWYMNDQGLVVGETTLGTGPYRWGNTPAFIRIRKAVQYASNVDEFTNIMLTDSNGAYCGDYMVCDAKNNEASIVELGSYEYEVWRSNNGFHGSCNYPWDPEVREEMGEVEGWEHGCYPRYYRLGQIEDRYYGEIDIDIAKRALGDHWDTVEGKVNQCSHTLCGHVENDSGYPHGSLDGKAAERSMVLNHEIWARYGHSCGQDFLADDHAAENPDYAWDNLHDMIAQPWTTFGFLEPIEINVINREGEAVEGAQIAFENCADGYLAEGRTGPRGNYSHPYFQTGTYNITVRKGDMRGKLHVDFNSPETYTVIIAEEEKAGMFGDLDGTTMGISAGMVAVILALLGGFWYRKRRTG